MPADSFQIDRPAMNPAAPAASAVRSWPTNVSWSTPAESSAHGASSASVSASQPAASPGYSSLRKRAPHASARSAPSRIRPARRAAKAERVLVVDPVHQHLDDEQQVGGGAVGGRRADQGGVGTVRVLAIGAQAHEELRRRPAQPPHAGRPDAGQELGRPQAAGRGDRAASLERDQKPGAPGKRAPLEHVGEGDLGIEQHAGRVRGERLDEVELEGAQRLDVGRKARLLARRDELRALVGRQDAQTAPRRGQLVERTLLSDREHSCSFLSNLKHFRA